MNNACTLMYSIRNFASRAIRANSWAMSILPTIPDLCPLPWHVTLCSRRDILRHMKFACQTCRVVGSLFFPVWGPGDLPFVSGVGICCADPRGTWPCTWTNRLGNSGTCSHCLGARSTLPHTSGQILQLIVSNRASISNLGVALKCESYIVLGEHVHHPRHGHIPHVMCIMILCSLEPNQTFMYSIHCDPTWAYSQCIRRAHLSNAAYCKHVVSQYRCLFFARGFEEALMFVVCVSNACEFDSSWSLL